MARLTPARCRVHCHAMAKPHSPKQLAELIDRLAPALRRLQGTGRDSGPRVQALGYLARRGPATMRELAAELSMSPQATTGLVDVLEAEGLLAREKHPTDRRKVVIRVNEHSAAAAKTAHAARADDLGRLFDGISKDDRAAFARVVETLLSRVT
ncbi:MAG: MarR family transcriptional regulator [Jannaschia sp.]